MSRTILVVDDDPNVVRAVQVVLEKKGMKYLRLAANTEISDSLANRVQ